MGFFTIEDKEERLAKRLQGGDSSALRDFYTLFGDYLTGVCARYISGEDDLKDVFQDALVQIITHVKDFHYRGPGSLQAWATRIVVNQSLHFLKEQRQHDWERLSWEVADVPEEDDPPVRDIPPEVLQQGTWARDHSSGLFFTSLGGGDGVWGGSGPSTYAN